MTEALQSFGLPENEARPCAIASYRAPHPARTRTADIRTRRSAHLGSPSLRPVLASPAPCAALLYDARVRSAPRAGLRCGLVITRTACRLVAAAPFSFSFSFSFLFLSFLFLSPLPFPSPSPLPFLFLFLFLFSHGPNTI